MAARTLQDWVMDPLVHKISRVAYTAVRDWCLITGQPVDGPWYELPDDYQLHMRNAVGGCFVDMMVPSARDMHDACLKTAIEGGWGPGPYDRVKKMHPDILPWEKLSFDQRMKEFILVGVIRAFLEG